MNIMTRTAAGVVAVIAAISIPYTAGAMSDPPEPVPDSWPTCYEDERIVRVVGRWSGGLNTHVIHEGRLWCVPTDDLHGSVNK